MTEQDENGESVIVFERSGNPSGDFTNPLLSQISRINELASKEGLTTSPLTASRYRDAVIELRCLLQADVDTEYKEGIKKVKPELKKLTDEINRGEGRSIEEQAQIEARNTVAASRMVFRLLMSLCRRKHFANSIRATMRAKPRQKKKVKNG